MKILKGHLNFAYINNEIQYYVTPGRIELNVCGTLMNGKDFYDVVDKRCITDDDGILVDVYIDGYLSNLGLTHKEVCQGNFMVDGPTWLDICDTFNVEVEWCSK